MSLYDVSEYMEDVKRSCAMDLPWEILKDKSVLLSGSTGLIGSFLIDVIMEKNLIDGLNCKIFALGRNEERAKERFSRYFENGFFCFIKKDVNCPISIDQIGNIDFVLHLASNTHPIQYSTDPIGTITANIIGLQNMLEFAVFHESSRFVFASSNEIYGENRGDVEFFDEDYCGYINSNTMRAGYPESKRCGEALCQAYKSQKGLDCVIARFTRTYGPTMLMSDTKAISQFIKKGIANEDIVLKSAGTQFYSYQYVSDAVTGLLAIMLLGENGEAYNIADVSGDITLKELANFIAELSGKKVIFEIPDKTEAAGYSMSTKARLSGEKLRTLGWKPVYNIKEGIARTIRILKTM